MESYQKIQQPYREEVKDIYEGEVVIEEKIDGSQFRIEIDTDGIMMCGSHHNDGIEMDSMFRLALESAKKIFDGYKPKVRTTIFCEYLSKPKQNSIPYERVPNNNLVLFDVKQDKSYLNRQQKEDFATKHGMDLVPCIWAGAGSTVTPELIKEFLAKPSFLGHGKGFDRVEGIVIKNYDKLYDEPEGHSLHGHFKCTKIVNDAFKEKNNEENPNSKNHFQELKEMYRNDARLLKAVQHLKEKGELKGELADLRFLVPEVIRDLEEEEKEVIKDALWKLFGKEICGYAGKGMPEFYKKYLLEQSG